MAKIDLKSLSFTELNALKSRVEKAIERHEKKRKAGALAELKAKAKELGLSLSDLAGVAGSTSKKNVSIKKGSGGKNKKPAKIAYRHPDDPSKTWVGRGPRPLWLREELAAGKELGAFKLGSSTGLLQVD